MNIADIDSLLLEAQYIRILLTHDFIDDKSPIAAKVTEDVRNFLRRRLMELVSRQSGQNEAENSVFSADEISVLKMVAAKFLGTKGEEDEAPKRRGRPKKAQQPQASAAPEVPAPSIPSIPVVNVQKVVVPEAVKQIAQETKPVTAPEPAPTPMKVAGFKVPAQTQIKPPPVASTSNEVPAHLLNYVKENNAIYRNGRVLVQAIGDDGLLLWEKDPVSGEAIPLYRDITPQARPDHTVAKPLPPLRGQAATEFAARQASELTRLRESNRSFARGELLEGDKNPTI